MSLGAGCGYRFTRGADLPGKARTLHVPVFKNLTSEPGLEGAFTDALRDELARAGREGGEASDAQAVGEVTSLASGGAIVTSLLDKNGVPVAAQLASYRVSATAVVRVMRGPEKLAETTVSGTEDYQPSSHTPGGATPGQQWILETEANRRLALQRLARSLMRQAYLNLASGF